MVQQATPAESGYSGHTHIVTDTHTITSLLVNRATCQLAACITNTTDELATLPVVKPLTWACFGMTRADTKFDRGLRCRQV